MKMIDKNKYLEFAQNDFLCDELFQDWVLRKDNDLFWQSWLKEHPQKVEMLETARAMILNIGFREDLPEQERVNASLLQALTRINEMEAAQEELPPVRRMIWHRKLARIAAIFILVLGVGGLIYQLMKKEPLLEMTTAFAHTKDILLPDSSAIVLNANSKISYRKTWSPGKPREVWLEGEAFFNVKHLDTDNSITGNERFLVHINDITVEVLGTSFNVRQRRGKTAVVLQSGRVRLLLNDGKGSEVDLVPGQFVSVEDLTKQYTNGSLKEIVQYLEDYYGINIVLKDPSLLNRKIEGTIMLDNLDDALFVLSQILNIKIVKENSNIIFMSR
jgi:transmembrane sensor